MFLSVQFMSSSLSSDCKYTEELYDLVPLQVIQWVYILTSISSIILVFYTARHYLHRTIFENVTKELIITLYIFIIIYSICLIIAQGSQLIYRYLAIEKCDAQVPKWWCILRYIITVITSSFVFVHVGITVQHLLASFHFGIRAQKIAARVSIAISFVFVIIFGVIAYGKDSLEGQTAYCSGFTANSEGMLMFNIYFLLILDILNTLVSLVLWKFNERKLFTDRQSFDLSLSFHRRQIVYAMEQFLPVAALHSIFYVVFFLTVYFSQSLRSSMSPAWYLFTSVIANVIPHYCFLCPLIFLLLIRRGRFKRTSHVHSMVNLHKNSNNVYFTALKEQWQ